MNPASGNVTGQAIKKNQGAENPRRLLQVQISDDQDVQTVELFGPSGEDTAPANGSRVIILSIGNAWKIAIGVDDGVTPEAEAGEKRLYSLDDDGNVKSQVWLRSDGTLRLNNDDDADNAVRYSALETAFNSLKATVDSLCTTFSLHTHAVTSAPGTTGPAGSVSAPTADISDAKIDEITVPGAA